MVVNQIRGYSHLAAALVNQQKDLFCGKCKALVNTTSAAREELSVFEREHGTEIQGLPSEFQRLLSDARTTLAGIALPADAVGQKKAGNCKLPEGVCFVKSARALLQKI